MTGQPNGEPPRVLIAGGGFAGFQCARALSRAANGRIQITMVNPEDYSLYTPLLPDIAGGLIDPRHAAIPLAESLRGVRLIRGMVTGADLDSHTAEVAVSGGGDQPRTLAWDRLVLTAGSVTRLFDVPGLREHALGLKTMAEALYLRDHLLGQLELSVSERDERRCQACRTVVVVGASYAGTELVAQLRGLAEAAARHYGFPPDAVRFLLLDVAQEVMPEVGPVLGRQVMQVLQQRGVDVRLGVTVSRLTDDQVTLSDDSVIPARTVAWVTGVTASPLVSALGLDLDHGRLPVSEFLSVPGHPDVFAAGDAAAVPDLTRAGNITPPTAQHAVRQGRAVARNLLASLGYSRPRRYRHANLGLVVDLGPGYAVANPFGVSLSGLPAKAVTRGYHLQALPRARNRLQVATDYLANLGSSRPVVSLGLVGQERAVFGGGEPELERTGNVRE